MANSIEPDTGSSDLSAEEREILDYMLQNEKRKKSALAQIKAGDHGEDAVLSFGQQRLWLIHELSKEQASPYDTLTINLRIQGKLNVDALRLSLIEIVRRHEILRTRFELKDDAPVQLVTTAELVFEQQDLSNLEPTERENRLAELVQESIGHVFDLVRGPLFKTRLIRLGEDDHTLSMMLHHIVFDNWSKGILMHELNVLYQAFSEGQASPLAELPIQYRDFSAWQRDWFQSQELQKQLAYWTEQLAGLPLLELPIDFPRPVQQSFDGAFESLSLPLELSAELQVLSKQHGATLYMSLLSALGILLSRYSGQHDIAIGTAIANRDRNEVQGLIGFFLNTLVMRLDLSGDPSFSELLERVRHTALKAYAHQHLPFEKLVEELQPERETNRTPLFQVSLTLVDAQDSEPLKFDDLEISPISTKGHTTRFDIEVYVTENATGLALNFAYNTHLFKASSIRRMMLHFQELLKGLASDESLPVGRLPMLTQPEYFQIVNQWNQTTTPYARDRTLPELFESQVAATPDSIAVEYGVNKLSYAQLNTRANQLAHYLRANGIGPEVMVGLYLERGPEMIVGLLGVLKAGGAYLPLDLEYPQTRLAFMLEDARVPVILSMTSVCDSLPDFAGKMVCLDSDWTTIAEQNGDNPVPSATADNLAYVIYTSGSTGTPKGVEIPQHAINRLVCGTDYYQVDASDRVAQASNVSFDAATFEIWGALLNGAQLTGISKEILLNSEALAAFLGEQKISVMFLTTAVFNQIAREVPEAFSSLKGLLFGGEAVDPDAVHRVLMSKPPARLLHVYGPTENTTFSSWYQVEDVANDTGTVPIGRPVSNSTLYVLDQQLQPLPVGVHGELYIGGDGLARGYLNRPELTAEKFVDNPFSARAGERLYRTGDKVRYRRDGAIEFIGRFDHQVKIRGFRIELGEIEAVLTRHTTIASAVAVVRDDIPSNPQLVAYVTGPREGEFDEEEFRDFLSERLPQYMLPSSIVLLDELPLSANGKVDRNELPDPAEHISAFRQPKIAPANTTEQQIADVFQALLNVASISVNDNFFKLGGHSLLAVKVVNRINKIFATDLSLARFMTLATVEKLAAEIKLNSQKPGIKTLPLRAQMDPSAHDETYPLSFAQERLWYIHALYPDIGAVYNIQAVVQLDVDNNKIVAILKRLQQQHAVLRTTYIQQAVRPMQRVNQSSEISLQVIDADGFSQADTKQVLLDLLAQPIDLESGPIWQSTILRHDDRASTLSIVIHHIAADGLSLDLLKREILRLSQLDTAEIESARIDPGIKYIDYVLWQREQFDVTRLEGLQAYWRDKLRGIPAVVDLPFDKPRPPIFSHSGAVQQVILSAAQTDELRQFVRENEITLFMLMLAVFKMLLSRYAQQSDIVVGTPVSGRTRSEMDDIVGLFVNSVVLRTELSATQTFSSLLELVRETTIDAFEHQDLPFEKIVEIVQPDRDISRNPVFQIMFSFFIEDDIANGYSLKNAEISADEIKFIDAVGSHVDLSFNVYDAGERLAISFVYNNDLFDKATISQMMTHFRRLLEASISSPETPIDQFEMLSNEEKQLILYRWNQTEADYVKNETLPSLFAQQVQRTPQACAVSFLQQSISFAELDQKANIIASLLRSRSVEPGEFVGVFLKRSIDFVVATLGILKAGAAYVPLDPDYPQERINFILADSNIHILLSQKKFANLIPHDMDRIYLDSSETYENSLAQVLPEVTEDMLAYVIYTSGSTGKPKGVMIPHAAVVNHAFWTRDLFKLDHRDIVLQKAPLNFDVSVCELFTSLIMGARVVLADPDREKDGEYLIETIRNYGITVLTLVPSALRILLQSLTDRAALSSLKRVGCGGEALSPELLQAYYAKCSAPFYNLYGPTEATIDATSYLCTAESDCHNIPIGYPVSNSRTYILDQQLRPVPIGVRGELHIAGAQLATGYLNQELLTQEKFIANPFCRSAGEKLYKTGDLARYRRDGAIEFCGRIDSQIKLRGFRIELAEIESVLLQHEQIGDAAVVVREDEPGDQRLVAYLVSNTGSAAEAAAVFNTLIHEYLKQELPIFMVPSSFEWMETLPLLPSGKLNYAELPRPSRRQKRTAVSNNKPESELEITMAKIWEDLLDIDDIETSDMFFDLGGHSLLTLKVVDRFAEETNIRLAPASLVHQTLRQLAATASASVESSVGDSVKLAGKGLLDAVKKML